MVTVENRAGARLARGPPYPTRSQPVARRIIGRATDWVP